MRFIYSLLVTLVTPFVLLYFAFRGLRDRAYLNRLSERFGFMPKTVKAGGILVHAASVGEFNAASPLIRALLKTYPGQSITVSSLTPTGSERVQRELGDKISHCYIPLDLPGAVSRFLSCLQPQLIIVMETEIWPNLYLQAQRLSIPLMMANARLSQRSVNRFQRMPGFIRDVLQTVDWIGAQSTDDLDRLTECGADPQAIELTGNLKFDLATPASLNEQGAALRSRWNSNRPVLVAGSTHEADESVVIPAFVELLKNLPDTLLILVPRYPERFARATQLAQAAGLRTELHSQGEACSEKAQCFVIDTIGELMTYYACGDVAFVGGSFGDQGGHNALEPAALGKAVLLGPNMDNAREIASLLSKTKAARRVTNQQDFRQAAEQILTSGVLRDSMGQAGKDLVEMNKGALDLTLKAVEKLL
ncbi:MAG: lipid IV(A) 3-deoxy-D-manno-octulosonic acid transferase [Xanthomonadales bacterium]|nr:lipid IV(A) 3-deoxy-D-manno-octulosonic acid transferase [Xanthomonadales bacterium]